MESCIYEGRVSHSRTRPALHRFRYRLFMMYLDLDELPDLFRGRWLWSAERFAIARFRREDHVGMPSRPLAEAVRDLVQEESGCRPEGPVRLLTNLAYFGYRFNPVSFYYCFGADGSTVEFIVAEVNNTPWGEQDTYVLDCRRADADRSAWRFGPRKKMHVSPFMPMDVEYDWALGKPGERLTVYMANSEQGRRIFDASMSLRRREITGAALAGLLLRFPLLTLKIVLAIYWQALRLWLKRCPVYVHPAKTRAAEAKSS